MQKRQVQALLTALGAILFASSGLAAVTGIDGGKLPTRWDKDINPASPLPDYPRPQMMRARWQSLNGHWDYGLTDAESTAAPTAYDGKILVPYPYESALSGVNKPSPTTQRLWYRRTFTVPAAWRGQRVLLHFGAVNWDSTVSVNSTQMGEHKGGYDAFDYDITDALKPGVNELIVSAQNPLKANEPDAEPLGKQRIHPGRIYYTGATGIWQTVWLEPVPAAHIVDMKLTPDVDAGVLRVMVEADGAAWGQARATAIDGGRTVAAASGAAGTELTLPIKNARLWSPDDPHLYILQVSLTQGGKGVDSVVSYFAMRKISIGKDAAGQTRILLNNKFVLQVGALDQGYWPDGIYTAPTDAALKSDIQAAKGFGFNLLRKHAKVEPDRWYYWTDKLGILVWQDMPQAFGDLNDDAKAQWLTEWKREITTHYNHPSIVVWTTFNEGWGENTFDVPSIVALTKQLDPTRLVNNASGWTDKGVGDIHDTHAYPGPSSDKPEATRAAVNGEFGGITMRVPGHMWTTDVFGYGSALSQGRQVTRRYQDLLKTAYKLRDTQGTSAFVYTQLTDVEQESNGLLTYDRAVTKPDAAIIAAANKGQFLPLPPDPHPGLLPTSQDEAQTWRYTTDKPADAWTQTGFDDSGWKSGPGGFGHGVGASRTLWATDDIWLRRTVTLPANLPAKLDFSVFHDEDVEIYVNGVLAATAPAFTTDYVSLPMTDAGRTALQPGASNVIAVHCHQTVGGQFIDIGIVPAP